MSRPTSRPPFSALICSILFTSDLPSRRRRVNKKRAPLPIEERHPCLSESPALDCQITRGSRLKRRARFLVRCGRRKLLQKRRFRSVRPVCCLDLRGEKISSHGCEAEFEGVVTQP